MNPTVAPGMQIDADVLLERRRLIEWIFEPVLSIAGRI
jgi:membrane fusion protein